MDDVISISSGDSDVEIVGVRSQFLTDSPPLPLSAVRVNHFLDLTNPQWRLSPIKLHTTRKSNSEAVIERDLEVENLQLDSQIDRASTISDVSNEEDPNQEDTFTEDSSVSASEQDYVPKSLQKENQQQNSEIHPCHHKPIIRLTRLPFLESNATELLTSRWSVDLTKAYTQLSLNQKELSNISKTSHNCSGLRTTTSDVKKLKPSLSCSLSANVAVSHVGLERDNSEEVARTKLQTQDFQHPQSCDEPCCSKRNVVAASPDNRSVEKKKADCSSSMISSPTVSPAQGQEKSQVHCSNIEQLERKEAMSHQRHSSSHSCPHFPVRLHTHELSNLESLGGFSDVKSNDDLPPTSEIQETERMESADESHSANTFVNDTPEFVLWQDGIDGEDVDEERKFGRDFRAVTGDSRHFVSLIALKKFMARPTQDPFDEDDDVGAPEELSRQRLNQVYTTIEVKYPEGTLQQLCDLLQPGYYLPGNITSHLLHDILLNRQCSHCQCVQAFNLLMRTQRHHVADITTIPWDWELLTSVMENQESADKHPSENVRMFLEYIIQTLEDDFHAKQCIPALQHSIAKATLSCEQQFPRVQDVIKWLFFVITKSTALESNAVTRERDEHIRMVKVFQRMLSLALEVDCSPALCSAKLSQELFHMLISNVPVRAHRMLLLETLQSKWLKCKLLEHLLDYACPVKISLPMSLSLLLHFLKHSTLVPDPSDGTEKWKKWDELMQLLWMLLFSYNKAMKGYLCSSKMDQRSKGNTLVYKPLDVISAPVVQEAVDAFLSRSKADLGEALPPHVEESLTYLQDHLLDACQR